MSPILLSVLFLVHLLCAAGIGYVIGVYKERTDWNRLITEGKIPTPGQRQ